jgi:protein-tyrosine phosphatase
MIFFNWLHNSYGGKKAFIRYVLYWIRSVVFGQYSRYRNVPNNVKRVVFVCKGNICRSAFAEWLFKQNSNISTSSLGLDTITGGSANDRIKMFASVMNVNLDFHKTTSVTDFTSEQGDLYVCMEPEHVDQLEAHLGKVNVVLLGWYLSPARVYIHDPYSASDQYAKTSLKVISEGIQQLQSHLVKE